MAIGIVFSDLSSSINSLFTSAKLFTKFSGFEFHVQYLLLIHQAMPFFTIGSAEPG
jgi:hypothetical protein